MGGIGSIRVQDNRRICIDERKFKALICKVSRIIDFGYRQTGDICWFHMALTKVAWNSRASYVAGSVLAFFANLWLTQNDVEVMSSNGQIITLHGACNVALQKEDLTSRQARAMDSLPPKASMLLQMAGLLGVTSAWIGLFPPVSLLCNVFTCAAIELSHLTAEVTLFSRCSDLRDEPAEDHNLRMTKLQALLFFRLRIPAIALTAGFLFSLFSQEEKRSATYLKNAFVAS
mmetsp:Transcript_33018/g.64386  ORF Transcript_33018/g.64386 Transcript_33018/m.64386 type:complete len:231 (-) Transcript_33018:158-850(-)